jgi:polar amino acid transport system permease protein
VTSTLAAPEAPTRRRMTRKNKTRITRIAQYVGLVVIVVLIWITGDWARFNKAYFNWHVMGQVLPRLIRVGFVNTLIYTVSAFVVGLVLGLIIALMRLSQVRLYRWLATIYVELFRGLPVLVVLFLVTFGLPLLYPGSHLTRNFYFLVAVGLGFPAAAYMSETIRAGIQAVPKGQTEAARTLGMSQRTALVTIILPQAFRIIIPPLTNEIILLVKDSSLVYALGLTVNQYEITKLTTNATTGGVLGIQAGPSPLILAALAYLVITLPLSQAVRHLERKQEKRR